MSSGQTSPEKPSLSITSRIFRPWRNQTREIKNYWTLYGGFFAILTSPFFQISVALGFLLPQLMHFDVDAAQTTMSIVPSLLGFAVGSMAILLAFSSSSIFSIIAEQDAEKSLFMKIVANFVHFIIVQALSLIIAVMSTEFPKYVPLRIAASIMLYYAILTTVSTGIQLFQVARIYNENAKP